ncbi:MAG: hypothetical protein ACK4N6_04505 [Rhodocyclaceae bacterium]
MMRKPMTPFDWALRWLNVILRGLHLVAVIRLGAAILGERPAGAEVAITVAVTGFAMFALDVWRKPRHLREAAGIVVLFKLAFIVWMVFDAAMQQSLFWLIVAGSAISAHAPARFRHAILIGRAPH